MNMLCYEKIERISRTMCLTPYQLYMLEVNADKYNLNKLVKYGTALYAPYKYEICRGFIDELKKIFFGPCADLIGPDTLLVFNTRGIKVKRFMPNN